MYIYLWMDLFTEHIFSWLMKPYFSNQTAAITCSTAARIQSIERVRKHTWSLKFFYSHDTSQASCIMTAHEGVAAQLRCESSDLNSHSDAAACCSTDHTETLDTHILKLIWWVVISIRSEGLHYLRVISQAPGETVSSHRIAYHIMSHWRQHYSYSYRRRKEMRVGSPDEFRLHIGLCIYPAHLHVYLLLSILTSCLLSQ